MSFGWIPYPQLPSFPEGAPLAIHPFGLLVATGIVVGSWLTIRRGVTLGLPDEKIKSMIFWTLLPAFIVSHVSDVLVYQNHPDVMKTVIALLDVRTGLSSMGGFAGAVWGLFFWCRKNHEPVMPYADSLAYGLASGWFLGRMGCFVAHDHPGERMLPGDPLWSLGVDYPCAEAPCGTRGDDLLHFGAEFRRHDMGLEEALFAATLATFFLVLGRFRPRQGVFVAAIATLYGPVRLLLDILRVKKGSHADVRWLGLTPAQYAAVLVTVVGLGLWFFVFSSKNKPVSKSPPETVA